MNFVLQVNSGTLSGKYCTLPQGRKVVVGRSLRCDFGIPQDIYLSSSHFYVELSDGRCSVADLNSRNGTFVNSKRLETVTVLHEGDVILAGATLFSLQAQPAVANPGDEIPLAAASQSVDSPTFEAQLPAEPIIRRPA